MVGVVSDVFASGRDRDAAGQVCEGLAREACTWCTLVLIFLNHVDNKCFLYVFCSFCYCILSEMKDFKIYLTTNYFSLLD